MRLKMQKASLRDWLLRTNTKKLGGFEGAKSKRNHDTFVSFLAKKLGLRGACGFLPPQMDFSHDYFSHPTASAAWQHRCALSNNSTNDDPARSYAGFATEQAIA